MDAIMTWNYVYTSYFWPSLATVLFLLLLSAYSWQRRGVPGAAPFAIGALFNVLWVMVNILENAAVDPTAKVFWFKTQGILIASVAVPITCFILEYAWPGRWVTRRNLALLSLPTLVIIALIATNDLHHLVWAGFHFEGTAVIPLRGLSFWVLAAYGLFLLLVDLIVLVWLFMHSPQNRWPVAFILVGQFVSRGAFLLERAAIIRTDLPLEMIWVAIEFLMYAIALFGFRILDPVSLARQTAIEQMQAGMLVLNPREKIVSLNPAAETILGTSAKAAKGKAIRELLPAYPAEPLNGPIETEISLGTGQAGRGYTLTLSRLSDWRGLEIGRLLMLRDVTEQKKAQAQILEQQRALATLHERERLARELHDDLAQSLALINLQAQLVSGLMDAGQAEQAREQLLTLAQAAREAQVDVRGEIYQLAHSMTPQEGFPEALRRFAETFQQTNHILTDLVLPGDLARVTISPAVEVQLLRIVQEAFANIRKHSGAKHVKMALTTGPDLNQPGRLRLAIEDDGVGFDLHSLPEPRQNFGLGIMAERASEVNGKLEVSSAPGQGTKIEVEVPVNGNP